MTIPVVLNFQGQLHDVTEHKLFFPVDLFDDKRSRDRYNVELRFKGYYISVGQTSLLQVQ